MTELAVPLDADNHSAVPDFSSAVEDSADGKHSLQLLVEGMRCASCAFTIEHVLQKEGVTARVNVTENRLRVEWTGAKERFFQFLQPVFQHGYKLTVFEAAAEHDQQKKEDRFLLFCLALSGFASGNIMLLSLGVWTTDLQTMGFAMRDVLHWFSALIALPTVAIAGQPFFRSAFAILKKGHTNMDVPISLAVILSSVMSIVQTSHHAEHTYFDSAVMLLFFLLIGRYLDFKARGKARSAARDLLSMMSGEVTVLDGGKPRLLPVRDVRPGMTVHVAAGEKILADGIVLQGRSDVDTAMLTGETLPQMVKEGSPVFAGMINLTAPLTFKVTAEKNESLIGEMIRLMAEAEQGQARYVRLADKIARAYTPVVHILALASFFGWLLLGHAAWNDALLIAIAVLIITCPCALGLAVPVVQVLASNRLFRQGILLKSGDALEKMAAVDTIVFDKTGTLTLGRPRLLNVAALAPDSLQKAASMAVQSRHPLSKAIVEACMEPPPGIAIKEIAGAGLEASVDGKVWRLGQRGFCGVAQAADDDEMELWFAEEGAPPQRFIFEDALREDAIAVTAKLKALGYRLMLYSGDRDSAAQRAGLALGLDVVKGGMSPRDKHDAIDEMVKAGRYVLYVGDGLNDAPALSVANVSMSPATAMDISQNAAALVFQGSKLAPVLTALRVSVATQKLVKQNFILAMLYNMFAIPLAVAGFVTPLIAALAMSSSSLVVIANALRLNAMKD